MGQQEKYKYGIVRFERHGNVTNLVLIKRFKTINEAHKELIDSPGSKIITLLEYELYKGHKFEYITVRD
jgi:hypothetical protein